MVPDGGTLQAPRWFREAIEAPFGERTVEVAGCLEMNSPFRVCSFFVWLTRRNARKDLDSFVYGFDGVYVKFSLADRFHDLFLEKREWERTSEIA